MDKEVQPLLVALIAIIKDNKVLLMKRNKEPYKGYWGILGEKIKWGETIDQAAERGVMEELKMKVKCANVNKVLHEFVDEGESTKHHFLFFLTKVIPESKEFELQDEGEDAKWFPLDALPENLVLSDAWMLKNLSDDNITIPIVKMREENGKLIKFNVDSK